jgi:CHAT domain-containing protein
LSIPRSGDDASPALDEQFDALTRHLDVLEYEAFREREVAAQPSVSEGPLKQSREAHDRRNQLLKQRADLLEQITIGDPRWRLLSQPQPLDLGTALKVLSARSQAVLTLYYEPPNLTAVLLYNGGAKVGQRILAADVPKNLLEFANNLTGNAPDLQKHDLSTEYSIQATDLIPERLLTQALAASSLLVIPHEILHLIPWSALMHQGKRLFEYLPVGILPNLASAIAETHFSKPRTAALLGVGHYPGLPELDLSGVGEEIKAIQSVYRAASVKVDEPLLDANATEAAFWGLAKHTSGSDNVLHVSCHGKAELLEPMNSGLLLFDSKVDAAEIARSKLPFDEVVLSACNTGWRPIKVRGVALTADEILGIPAGFLEAGVKAILVSISKAQGEAASALTTHYHTRRAANDPPLAAFQAAQKLMLESGAKPGTWVGFALYGCV